MDPAAMLIGAVATEMSHPPVLAQVSPSALARLAAGDKMQHECGGHNT